MAEMLEFPLEEIIGSKFTEYLHPDEIARVFEIYRKRMAGEPVERIYESRLVRSDGSAIHVEINAGVVTYLGKEADLAMVRDVTERKLAEEALRLSEEYLATTLDSIGDAVISTDAGGKVVRMNPVAETLTGWSVDEAVGRDFREIFKVHHAETKETVENPVARVLREGKVEGLTDSTVLVARDGSELQIADSGAPIRDREGKTIGVVLVFRDITEENRLRNQLLHAQKMEAVGQLAGGVAHDFNNLLAIIKGNADLALLRLGKRDPRRKDFELILKTSHRAADLIHQLLTFSRKQARTPTVLDMNEILTEMDNMLQRIIVEGIELVTRPGKDLWKIRADTAHIEQIVVNLAVNARDSMSAGGTLTIETENAFLDEDFIKEHPVVVPGDYVRLTVSDTGCGMSGDLKSKIFEPFFTTKTEGKGTGLGLATVYGIIKQSAGYIFVDSEEGKGTTFHIYLPRVSKHEEALHEAGVKQGNDRKR